MDYNSKYKSSEIEEKLDLVGNLAEVATSGDYNDLANKPDLGGYATKLELSDKVDKVSGKQLSTEDFTTALKNKLEELNNYDDTEIENALASLQGQLNTLVSGNASDAINSFNEIIAFLNGIEDSESLDSIIASIEQQIAGKMDKVTLATVATSGSYEDLSNKPSASSLKVLPLAGGKMNDGAEIQLSLYGARTLTLTGNSILADMSKDTGTWAGAFSSVKDPVGDITTMLGWYGNTGGLTHFFLGGTYYDPTIAITKAQDISFKKKPTVDGKQLITSEDNVASATKAEQDSVGNNIVSTYATKVELSDAIASAITTTLNTEV